VQAALNGNVEAADAFARLEEHLGKDHNIKLEDWSLTLGRPLTIDADSGMATDADANTLLQGRFREGFKVPEAL
jgi:hypothetical protein